MKSDLLVDCDVKHETCLPGLVSDMFHILSLQKTTKNAIKQTANNIF